MSHLAANGIQVSPDAVVEAKERHAPVAIDDLIKGQLGHIGLGLGLSLALAHCAHVSPDPKLFRRDGVPPVCPLHVLVHLRRKV
jgi:hypothetical protein